MMQFTYICRSGKTHVVCINGENFTYVEDEPFDRIMKDHGFMLRIGSVCVYQTLYFRLQSDAVHLAEVVRAIEIARFIWQHLNMLKLLPEAKQ